MLTKLFFPAATGVRVDRVYRADETVHLVLVVTRRTAACPVCQHRSRHVHSRYHRTLADLPCAGDVVTIQLIARRFVCRQQACPRRIFTERLPGVVAPFARKTARLVASLQREGIALGGNPGARHATADSKRVSRRTLLRLVRALPLPSVSPLHVVGIDDWARRKGRTYGTIVVDLERHRVIDLLPDRTADTVAAWLQTHPSIEIASRDRAGAYADGIRRGSPTAIQVADRFHLRKNLMDAVEHVLHRHRPALKQAADAVHEEQLAEARRAEPAAPSIVWTTTPPAPLTSDHCLSAASRERRRTRDFAVLALQGEGLSLSAIARQMHLTRSTVRTILRAGPEGVHVGRSLPASAFRPFEPYLWERWAGGCQNARVLFEEIRAQGSTGSDIHLRRALRTWRTGPAYSRHATSTETADGDRPAGHHPPLRLVSPRQAAWLLVSEESTLDADERRFMAHLQTTLPSIGALQQLARTFITLLHQRDGGALSPWLVSADQSPFPEFHGFAGGLRRDLAAVTAALTSPWSNGQTEGQVNRLKVLKRAMYGRAKDDLLRLRLVKAA